MPVIALITWIVTVLGGLFLLAIWLIEYDPDFQRAAATRLPVPVISGHALLALGGLGVWVMYLITDNDTLAWITLADLAIVLTFGVTMAVRWVGVYRGRALQAGPDGPGAGDEVAVRAMAGGRPAASPGRRAWAWESAPADVAVPPERHFPLPVVVGHGLFAVTTVTLVLLTTVGGIGS